MNALEKSIYATLPTLVELGKRHGRNEPGRLPRALAYGVFWHRWEEVLSEWSAEEISNLIKGFVYFEKLSPSNGFGSVAPTPQIFSVYSSRVRAIEIDALADWVLGNTVNEYCPFGTHNHGAKSLKELALKNYQIMQSKLETQSRETARECESKAKRAHDATLRLPRALERNDVKAVIALISKGANPDYFLADGSTARQIAKDLGRDNLLLSPDTSTEQLLHGQRK